MAYVFFIISALMVVTQQMTVKSSQDNTVAFDKKSWNMPDFSNNNRGKNVLLVDREPWIPSKTSQLTFLSPSQPLRVELKLNRDAQQSVIESCDLLIKCHARDTSIQQALNLISNNKNPQWKVSNPLCNSELGFVVEIHNITSYGIKMLPESKVPFNQSLEHHMEFSIRIRYKQGTLISAELYAFSLNSLFNINSQVTRSSTSSYRRFFLTWQAIAFLMGYISDLNLELDKPVVKIKFLEKGLLDVVKKAPTIIGALFTVTVTLKISYSRSHTECKRYLISNGEDFHIKQSDTNRYNNNYVRHRLSLETGQLLIDRSFLTTLLKEWNGATVDIALRVSLNGLRSNSQVERTVVSYGGAFRNIFLPPIPDAKQQLECLSVDKSSVSVIPHYTGMQDVVLTSPVVCPKLVLDTKSQDYTASVTYDCNQNCPIGQSQRIRRLEDNSKIIIQGQVGKMDLGKYQFTTKHMAPHTYEIVEADLPTLAALPDVINTNRFAMLELECRAPWPVENYKFMQMSLHFRAMNAYKGDKWYEVTLDEFVTKWLGLSPNKIKKIRFKKPSQQFGYKIYLPLFYLSGKWQVSFICRVKVNGPEVKSTLGIPQYESEVVTPINYYRFGETEKSMANVASNLVSQDSGIKVACFAINSIAIVHLTLMNL